MPYDKLRDEQTIGFSGGSNASQPKVTALTGGGYVVAWQQGDGDPSDDAVYMEVVNAAGQAVAFSRVNTHIQNSQNFPDVTALSNGGFVVTWSDQIPISPPPPGEPEDGPAIRAQIYTAAGVKVGGEFLVNTTIDEAQFSSTVAGLDGGGFVALWSDDSGDPVAGRGVRGQVFDNAGAKVGGEFSAPGVPSGETNFPDAAAVAGGGFVVVWQDSGQAGDLSGNGVFGRLFSSTGAPVGGQFQVNTTTAGQQEAAAVSRLSGGGFVVTWQDTSHVGGDTSGSAVRAQVFDAAGVKVGGEVLVNTTTAGDQNDPSVSEIPGGGFVVTWADFTPHGLDASGSSIRGQLFDALGARIGTEFLINTTTNSYQSAPAVTKLANGDFVVAWQDPNGYFDSLVIKTQVFSDLPPDPGTNDTLSGTNGADSLEGRNGDDTLVGGLGADSLYGGAGDDVLRGGMGADYLSGGMGTDTADFSDLKAGVSVYVTLEGGGSASQSDGAMDGLSSIENVRGSKASDEIYGNDGANKFRGESGNDGLYGGGGDDVLQGDGGDDIINGGTGYDVMSGGAGHDTFVFTETPEGDLIADWQAGEKIQLAPDTFITAVQLVHQYGRTWAYFDTGDGVYDDGWILIQNANVQQSDFVFGP